MEPMILTVEELQEYVQKLPEGVILRVTIEDAENGRDEEV